MTTPSSDFDVITGPSVPRVLRDTTGTHQAASAVDGTREHSAAPGRDAVPSPHAASAAPPASAPAMLRAR